MVATVGAWFVRRRTTALGVAVAGIGVGTLVAGAALGAADRRVRLAHRLRRARRRRGRRCSLLASLGAHRPPLGLHQAPAPLRRGRARPRLRHPLHRDCLLLSTSLFVPFVFIKSYATDEGIDAGPAATLVGIIGASSVVGRLGLGALGGRLGATRLMQLSFAIADGQLPAVARRRRQLRHARAVRHRHGRRLRRLHRPRPGRRRRPVRDGRARRHPRRAVHGRGRRRSGRPADRRRRSSTRSPTPPGIVVAMVADRRRRRSCCSCCRPATTARPAAPSGLDADPAVGVEERAGDAP